MMSLHQARQSVSDQTAQDRTDPITVIVATGLAAGVIVPWAVIWVSDLLFFDVPAWSQWVIFGGPATLSLLATLILWDGRTGSQPPVRARVAARRGRG
jgi:hypothetical protein